ncbi:AglZ/HisF2 family acetamidino modification protein [Enterovibrio norvegicus]|uniref:AglZ/HisF2 family acetamidino modification protein n=1 Tax=Enterovibrio norvegicus TaxID=188144 RepID=UPI0038999A9C
MLRTRVIPVLLLDDEDLVKGEKFKKHKYVGDPINAVRIFNEKEVDELAFLDISATLRGREPNYSMIEEMASEAFMPMAYGGGVSDCGQVEKLFKCGVEKIVVNSAFYDNPNFIVQASKIAGSQSIVVSIDVKKSLLGKWDVYSGSGSKKERLDPVSAAIKAQELGAGELVITAIDREGTNKGYDIPLVQKIVNAVDIPVIANGGAATLNDFNEASKIAGASAVAAGRQFIFHGKHKAVLITYPSYSELKETFR